MAKSKFPRATGFATSGRNSALDAHVRELAGFFAQPTQVRLTEEQRAMMLGIARRLIFAVGSQLESDNDLERLWSRWSCDGIPAAAGLALPCFIRAEEYRWRQHMANRVVDDGPSFADDGNGDALLSPPAPSRDNMSPVDRAFLKLRIADSRRLDPLDMPCLPVSDIPNELYQMLALDIAAFELAGSGNDPKLAQRLGTRVKAMVAEQRKSTGIDAACRAYFRALEESDIVNQTVADIFARQQWWAAVAIAAGINKRGYDEIILAMIGGTGADIEQLFDPLAMDPSMFSPLVASLESLPHRPVASGGQPVGDSDFGEMLQSRAAALTAKSSDGAP